MKNENKKCFVMGDGEERTLMHVGWCGVTSNTRGYLHPI